MLTRRTFNLSLLISTLTGWLPKRGQARVPYAPLFDFCIAGGYYHGLAEVLDALRPGVRLALEREPDNPHDANAVAVLWQGRRVGYVPREANPEVARMMDRGVPVRAVVVGTISPRTAREIPEGLRFTDFVAGDPVLRLEAARVDV